MALVPFPRDRYAGEFPSVDQKKINDIIDYLNANPIGGGGGGGETGDIEITSTTVTLAPGVNTIVHGSTKKPKLIQIYDSDGYLGLINPLIRVSTVSPYNVYMTVTETLYDVRIEMLHS